MFHRSNRHYLYLPFITSYFLMNRYLCLMAGWCGEQLGSMSLMLWLLLLVIEPPSIDAFRCAVTLLDARWHLTGFAEIWHRQHVLVDRELACVESNTSAAYQSLCSHYQSILILSLPYQTIPSFLMLPYMPSRLPLILHSLAMQLHCVFPTTMVPGRCARHSYRNSVHASEMPRCDFSFPTHRQIIDTSCRIVKAFVRVSRY